MADISLNIGLNALLTAQSALDTIGHNIANANTPGYSRQNLQVSASSPMRVNNLVLGSGVNADVVRRTVDGLLTQRTVVQLSSVHRLEARLGGMTDVEALLGEPGEFGLSTLLDNLFASLGELSASPEDLVLRTGVTQSALSLASQFNQLADGFSSLRMDAVERIRFHVGEVNSLADQVVTLNGEITASEANGVAANDLRDQREEVLRQLAERVDVTYREDEVGNVRVLLAGQLLVGGTHSNTLSASIEGAGEVSLHLEGGTRPIAPKGGKIGGISSFLESFVPTLEGQLDQLAENLVLEMNRLHSTGIPLEGGFRQLTGSVAVMDTNGNASVIDEPLTDAALPFAVQAGALYVNLRSVATDIVTTHRIEVDPSSQSLGDVLDALSAVPGLSASVDTFGRVNVLADSGFTFDFGARLIEAPDVAGSFGGGRASLGSAEGQPFSLAAGDTLDLSGAVGPFTVTFDPNDFADIDNATAAEVAAAINADGNTAPNGLRAVAVAGQVFLQTLAEGSAESFSVAGGSALAALGFAPGVSSGHDTSVDVRIGGTFEGVENELFTFRPSADGMIGTTPGLLIEVVDSAGAVAATLDVGADYEPGTELSLGNGLHASFTFGEVSASSGDAFVAHAIADADTSDVLVALGLNSFFNGSDARTIEVRDDIAGDPRLFAASASGATGDNGALLRMLSLQETDVAGLNGSLGSYYGEVVASTGFEISSTSETLQVEQYLVESLTARRDQMSGVNVDEELVNMIQYEQAFGAAAQFIQVVNTINEELLNIL